MADEIIQVVTTTADKQDAETLAQALLTKRLAGCVQISGPIDSSYWWNGRIETGTEWTCVIKTIRSLYREVEQTLLDLHPYDQPEILAIAVSDVSEGYAQWLREQVQPEFLPEAGSESSAELAASAPAQERAAPADDTAAETGASPTTVPAAADITPAQAAELIPAAGLAAAAQSNVPQAMPFAAGNVRVPGAISEQLAAAPESEGLEPANPSHAPQANADQPSPASESPGKSKKAPRKKSPKPSV